MDPGCVYFKSVYYRRVLLKIIYIFIFIGKWYIYILLTKYAYPLPQVLILLPEITLNVKNLSKLSSPKHYVVHQNIKNAIIVKCKKQWY